MNLETVHFEELTMSDKKPTEEDPAAVGPQLLQELGAISLDPSDLPAPAEGAWESLREEVASLEKDEPAVAAQ